MFAKKRNGKEIEEEVEEKPFIPMCIAEKYIVAMFQLLSSRLLYVVFVK